MNPRLALLRPYPFERLRTLLAGVEPPPLKPIPMSIGSVPPNAASAARPGVAGSTVMSNRRPPTSSYTVVIPSRHGGIGPSATSTHPDGRRTTPSLPTATSSITVSSSAKLMRPTTSRLPPSAPTVNSEACSRSGHAQPGQSNPSGWFACSRVFAPSTGISWCSRWLVTDFSAPQPPAGPV